MKVFSGTEFNKMLSEDTLRDSLLISGMVKKSDDASHLMFDIGGACAHWVKIPVEMIEEDGVNWFGKVSCKDHQHDYVELTLRWPHDDEAAVFAELLKHTEIASRQVRPGELQE